MRIETIDLATNSPQFVILSGKKYKKQNTPLPNKNLPKSLLEQLNVVYSELTDGESLSPTDNSFLIKADSGIYTRLFGPILKVHEDKKSFVIQWGSKLIPVILEKGELFITKKDGERQKIDAEFGMYNFSGRGDDCSLLLSVDTLDDSSDDVITYIMPIAVRFSTEHWDKKYTDKQLNAFFKKKPEDLLEILQVYKEVSLDSLNSSSNLTADFELDLKTDIEENVPYEVIGYYSCKTTYGTNYRIFVKTERGLGCAWSCPSIRNLLSVSPLISKECPATLTIVSKKVLDSGKTSIKASLVLSEQSFTDKDKVLDLAF